MSFRKELRHILQAAYRLQSPLHAYQCPRGMTSAVILNTRLEVLAQGRNLLPAHEAPCTCDCGTDTLVAGSSSCKAVHAEAAALELLRTRPRFCGTEAYIATTRPPCMRCLSQIKCSNISVIATTDQYPDRDNSEQDWDGVWIVLPYSECNLNVTKIRDYDKTRLRTR